MVKTVFDVDLAQQLIDERGLSWRLQYQASCPSTQALAREAISGGAGPGLVIVTDHQTSGRGRLGATWSDQPGSSLLFSGILDRRTTTALIPLLAGMSVAEAIAQVTGLQPALKWPNDILCRGLKLAGILAEATADSIIFGVGLNANTAAQALPPSAGSIIGMTGVATSREQLLAAILEVLVRNLAKSRLLGDGWIVDRWKSRAALLGEAVEITIAGQQRSGIAEDIDESGRLWIRLPDGERIGLVAGEVRSLRPARPQS